jgi:cytosine/adenosine deaminase-related metal-dependent hydrolase
LKHSDRLAARSHKSSNPSAVSRSNTVGFFFEAVSVWPARVLQWHDIGSLSPGFMLT